MSFVRPLKLQNNNYSICGVRMPLSDTHDVSSASMQARIDKRAVEIDGVRNIIANTRSEIKQLQKRGDFDSPVRKGLNFKIHDQRKKLRGLLWEQERDQDFKDAMERQEAQKRATASRLYMLQRNS